MILKKFVLLIKDYWQITIKHLKRYWIFLTIFIAYLLFFHFVLPEHPNCLIKLIIGFPCPGCGLTRSFLSLARFDLKAAFSYHPMFWLVLIFIFVIMYNERPIINKIYKSRIFIIFVGLSFLLCYILRMIYVFPDVPMDPYFDALLGKILIVIKESCHFLG